MRYKRGFCLFQLIYNHRAKPQFVHNEGTRLAAKKCGCLWIELEPSLQIVQLFRDEHAESDAFLLDFAMEHRVL